MVDDRQYLGGARDDPPAARGLQSRAREAAGQRPGYCANAGLGSGKGIIGSIAQRGGLSSLDSETLQGYDEEVRVRLAALGVLATGDGISAGFLVTIASIMRTESSFGAPPVSPVP